MAALYLQKISEVFVKVTSDDVNIESKIYDLFSFKTPGHQFSKAYKKQYWDGKKRLYNIKNHTMQVGLVPRILGFANKNNCTVEMDDSLFPDKPVEKRIFKDWVKDLDVQGKEGPITPEEYQIEGAFNVINKKRGIIVSATGTGKSLIMYFLTRWYLEENCRVIIIVPSTGLVEQLYKEFEQYSKTNGFITSDHAQKLYSGFPREFSKDILITTWQSVYKQDKKWFEQFDVVIGDEAHGFKSQSLTSLMNKMTTVKYRIGTTGTLQNNKIHRLVLEGMFGTVETVSTFKSAEKIGRLTNLKIKIMVLDYADETKTLMRKQKYHDEMNFLVDHEIRNRIIRNLACKLKGNTLVLFNFVERHGKPLYHSIRKKIKEKSLDKHVFFIAGEVDTNDREYIRENAERINNCIIVASYGTFSTGVNVPSIENIIFAHPYKSKIRNLQSIGRGLRVKEGKTHCTLYDIADNLTTPNSKKQNYSLRHATERLKIYKSEKFDWDIVKLKMET